MQIARFMPLRVMHPTQAGLNQGVLIAVLWEQDTERFLSQTQCWTQLTWECIKFISRFE